MDWLSVYAFAIGLVVGGFVGAALMLAHQISTDLKENKRGFNKSVEDLKECIRDYYGVKKEDE